MSSASIGLELLLLKKARLIFEWHFFFLRITVKGGLVCGEIIRRSCRSAIEQGRHLN